MNMTYKKHLPEIELLLNISDAIHDFFTDISDINSHIEKITTKNINRKKI